MDYVPDYPEHYPLPPSPIRYVDINQSYEDSIDDSMSPTGESADHLITGLMFDTNASETISSLPEGEQPDPALLLSSAVAEEPVGEAATQPKDWSVAELMNYVIREGIELPDRDDEFPGETDIPGANEVKKDQEGNFALPGGRSGLDQLQRLAIESDWPLDLATGLRLDPAKKGKGKQLGSHGDPQRPQGVNLPGLDVLGGWGAGEDEEWDEGRPFFWERKFLSVGLWECAEAASHWGDAPYEEEAEGAEGAEGTKPKKKGRKGRKGRKGKGKKGNGGGEAKEVEKEAEKEEEEAEEAAVDSTEGL